MLTIPLLFNLPHVHSTVVYMCLQHTPLHVVKRFLSARVYAEAPNQTISENDWELRKAAIFLKFFQAVEERACSSIMEKVAM